MLKLSSNPKSVAKVETFVSKIVRKYKLNDDVYGNILISLTEAVNNAIRHGNHSDESKTVRVQMQKQQDYICFEVSDEGRGFDFKTLPDPTCPENLLKIGGRGVFLMQQLADNLEFQNNGSTVIMHFKSQ